MAAAAIGTPGKQQLHKQQKGILSQQLNQQQMHLLQHLYSILSK
jgi:hypothetical protein